MTISENELLDALATMGQHHAPPHAQTAGELRAALGIGKTALNKRLAQLKAEGRLVSWRATRVDVTGRPQCVPAYTILPEADAPKATSKRKR